MFKKTMRSQCRVSVPFSPFSARSFWKRFREADRLASYFNFFLLFFSAQREKIPPNFPYMSFLLTLRRYKMAEEKLSKFWFI